jgi:hypothetical protein
MFTPKDRPLRDAAASSRTVTLAAPTHISSNLRQESQISPLVSDRLRTLWPAQNLQPAYFQSPTHSLQQERKLTPHFQSLPHSFCALLHKSENQLLYFHARAHDFGEMGGWSKIAKAERKSPAYASAFAPPIMITLIRTST